MNQGRIWCVVSPNVGLPLFLGSVAVTSLIVHYTILTNTPWMSSYWSGKAGVKKADVNNSVSPLALNTASGDSAFVIKVAPVAGKGETSFVITVAPAPATTADASVKLPETLALAAPAAQ